MRHSLSQFIFKSAIALIDIEIILFVKIIADVYVGIHVAIQIANRDPKTISNFNAGNTSIFAYINKMSFVVSHQFVTERISYFPRRVQVKFVHVHKTVVKYIRVKITIEVIV